MKEEALNAAVVQFMRNVSLTAQREIKKGVRNAVASGKLKGSEAFTASVTFASEKVGLDVTIYSKIELP